MNKVPLLAPVYSLLMSRKFATVLLCSIVAVVVVLIPALDKAEIPLLFVLTVLAVANVLGISYEDAAQKVQKVADALDIEVDKNKLREVILEVLETIGNSTNEVSPPQAQSEYMGEVQVSVKDVSERIQKMSVDILP